MQNTIDNSSAFDYNIFMKAQRKKARVTAIALASATIISLIFLVFSFIQKAEAVKARAEADFLRQEMNSIRKHAEEQMNQAKQMQMMAQEERMKQEMIAVENARLLEACAKSKK
jgi:predicted tellurium resistance membrane protein TerC